MNYREKLADKFPNIFSSSDGFLDPNKTIDEIVSDDTLEWYPPHLYQKERIIYLIYPFSFFDYVEKKELIDECEKAQTVCSHIREKGYQPKVMLITNTVEDSNVLHSINLSTFFGIIHFELDQPYFESSIDPNFIPIPKLIPFAVQYLSQAKALRGFIGKKVVRIATVICNERVEVSTDTLRKWITELLRCDKRFVLDNEPIEFMSSIERLLSDRLNIRDHYFHAFNTMLMGFVVIDQNYERFIELCNNYGSDIVVEYTWLITSLYHDIGYPAMLFDQITKEIFSDVEDTEPISRHIHQLRQEFWDNQYQKAAQYLNSFFLHVCKNSRQRWLIDPFPYPTPDDKLLRALKKSYVECGYHGTQGALKLMQMIGSILADIGNQEEREFIYRHIVISSISILFHDQDVRSILRSVTCTRVKSFLFPLSALLTYIDVLQDDRRDITSSYCRPDILRSFKVIEGAITGVLDMSVLEDHRKSVIQSQLSDVLSFFEMNGIELKMPVELV